MADTTTQSHIDDRWDAFTTEPVPDYDGDYCHTHQTESGHIKMMSDTPDQEFILTQHADGSYRMYLPGGKIQEKVEGDFVQLVVKNNKIWIKGSSLIHVDGHANINVGKNAYVGVDGDLDVYAEGNARFTSKKTLTLQGESINIVGKNEISSSTKEYTFPNTTIRGDLHVNGTIHALGDVYTTSTMFSQLGYLTPGSLVVGPLAYAMEKHMMILNFVTITAVGINPMLPFSVMVSATGPTFIESMSYMNISAIGALSIDAGGIIDILAGGATTIESGGAATIDAGGAVEIAAGGLIDIAAGGAVGIQGSFISIEPDLSVGWLLSILGHIHGNGNMGTPTTPPIPGT